MGKRKRGRRRVKMEGGRGEETDAFAIWYYQMAVQCSRLFSVCTSDECNEAPGYEVLLTANII